MLLMTNLFSQATETQNVYSVLKRFENFTHKKLEDKIKYKLKDTIYSN